MEIKKIEHNPKRCPNIDQDNFLLIKAHAYYFTFNLDSSYYYRSLVYQQTSNENHRIAALSGMAQIHSFWGDHTKAVKMLEKELKKGSLTELNKQEIYNPLCRALFGLEHFEKALPYLKKSLNYAERKKDTINVIGHLNNIGNCYYEMGELDSALTTLLYATELNSRSSNTQNDIALTMSMAMIKHAMNPTEEHLNIFKDAFRMTIKRKWYHYAEEAADYIHEHYKSNEQMDSAYLYLNLTHQLNDSLDGDLRRLQAIEHKIDFEQERYNLLSEKREKESQLHKAQLVSAKRMRYLLITLLGLVIVLWGALILRKRSKLKQKALLLEQKIMSDKLSEKEQKLLSSMLSIAGNSKYIDELKESIDSISTITETEKVDKIKRDLKNIERFDSAWKSVRIQMENAYPKFIEELEIKHPGLSDQDIQLCTFIKLRMNTNDISTLLNLQKRTIQTKKYRLKKRLKITEDLSAYICRIGNEHK
ncbi:MAG: tetratricopeptide repeat protein [Crocinitomicaceae bacterium]|nr:tetratricopeptide repeat protein [Crocinitomicaceae bacterium]